MRREFKSFEYSGREITLGILHQMLINVIFKKSIVVGSALKLVYPLSTLTFAPRTQSQIILLAILLVTVTRLRFHFVGRVPECRSAFVGPPYLLSGEMPRLEVPRNRDGKGALQTYQCIPNIVVSALF